MRSLLSTLFVAVVASAVPLAGASTFPTMQLNSLAAYGAVCLDGSTAGYYFAPGSGSGSRKFYIDHQGGGWCK